MRIAFLSYFYPPQIGGIQVLLDQISRGLVKQWGHSVLVITRPWPDKAPSEEIDGLSIFRTSGLTNNNPARLGVELWRILRTRQIDILICVEPRLRWSLPALLVTQLLRLPLFLLLAGTSSEAAHPISRWVAGLGAQKIIGISHYALKQYGCWSSRWHMIHCGVSADRLTPPTGYGDRKDIVLTVARVVSRKNLEMVIRVAHLLPQYQFFIVGDNSSQLAYFKRLQQLIKELQVENVVFTNRVTDEMRDRFYQEARLFFLPTAHEMFGIVFVEAMAAGLPIVATNLTAVPEVVNQQVGELLPLSSPPEAFARVIEGIISSPETWSTLSANAFQRAAEFQWEKMIQRYAEVFVRAISERKGKDNGKF